MRITNSLGVNLPLAVWLLHDEYDYVKGVDNYISVTTLMKPLRQIVLPPRIPPEDTESDVIDFIARRLGHSIHDSIERSWIVGHQRALKMLGYPDSLIEKVRINPTPDEVDEVDGIIPVYLEQRMLAEFEGYTIGGKFDMITEGIVNDSKSTSVWGWIKGTRDDEHKLQMSLYRWLDSLQPDIQKITEDYGNVNYIFTDWSKAMSRSTPNYPQRVETKRISLMSLDETENWVRAKLAQIERNKATPESQLPECTDEELWRSAPQFKYYSDPAKANTPGARSSKNFDDLASANAYLASKGGRGVVITVPGEVKACAYCAAFNGCTQKDRYL